MTPKCPEIAAEKLEQFRRAGITPTPDQIAELLYWGYRVQYPAGAVGLLSEDSPVAVGGRILWPMTLQAHEWLRWAAESLPGEMALAARGYAAEHGREPAAFDALYLPRLAITAVRQWMRTFEGTPAQLAAALDYLSDPPRREKAAPGEDPEDDPPVDTAAVVADLVARTGLPAEYFMRSSGPHFLRVARASAINLTLQAGNKISGMRSEDDALWQFTLLCREITDRGKRDS